MERDAEEGPKHTPNSLDDPFYTAASMVNQMFTWEFTKDLIKALPEFAWEITKIIWRAIKRILTEDTNEN